MNPFLECLDQQFSALHVRSRKFVEMLSADILFKQPRKLEKTFAMFSCGEYILRSAGVVEQTFGGITTTLWDDPFEWTLPEKLSTTSAIVNYLDEVEQTRILGFKYFASDDDLCKKIPSPVKIRSIFAILLDTIARAEHFQGRAFAVFQSHSDEKLPPLL